MELHKERKIERILDESEIEKQISFAENRKTALLKELEWLTSDSKDNALPYSSEQVFPTAGQPDLPVRGDHQVESATDNSPRREAIIEKTSFISELGPEKTRIRSSDCGSTKVHIPLVPPVAENKLYSFRKISPNLQHLAREENEEFDTIKRSGGDSDVSKLHESLNGSQKTTHPQYEDCQELEPRRHDRCQASDRIGSYSGRMDPKYPRNVRKEHVQRGAHMSALVSVSKKTLTSKDWQIVLDESKYMGIMRYIELLKWENLWSFKQIQPHSDPEKSFTHSDYLMEEMKWLQIDFFEERRWKMGISYIISIEAEQLWRRMRKKHNPQSNNNPLPIRADSLDSDEIDTTQSNPQEVPARIPLDVLRNDFFIPQSDFTAFKDFPALKGVCSDNELRQSYPQCNIIEFNPLIHDKWIFDSHCQADVYHIRYTTSRSDGAQIKEPNVKRPSVYPQHYLNILSSPFACKVLLSSAKELEYNWSAIAHEIISHLENGGYFKKYPNYIPVSMQWVCYSKYLELSSSYSKAKNISPNDAHLNGKSCVTPPKCKKKSSTSKKRAWEDTILSSEINANKIFRSFSTITYLANLREVTKVKKLASTKLTSSQRRDPFTLNSSSQIKTTPTSSLELSGIMREFNMARCENGLYSCSSYQSRLTPCSTAYAIQNPATPHQCTQKNPMKQQERVCRTATNPDSFRICRMIPAKQHFQAPANNYWRTTADRDCHAIRVRSPDMIMQPKCSVAASPHIKESSTIMKSSPMLQHTSSPINVVRDLDGIPRNTENTVHTSPVRSAQYVSASPHTPQGGPLISPCNSPEIPESVQYKLALQQQPKPHMVDQVYAYQRPDMYPPKINSHQYMCYHVEPQNQRILESTPAPQVRRMYEIYPEYQKAALNPVIDQVQNKVGHQDHSLGHPGYKITPQECKLSYQNCKLSYQNFNMSRGEYKLSSEDYNSSHQTTHLSPFGSPAIVHRPSKLGPQYWTPQNHFYAKQPATAPAAPGCFYFNNTQRNKLVEKAPSDHPFHYALQIPHFAQYNLLAGNSQSTNPSNDQHDVFIPKKEFGRIDYTKSYKPVIFSSPQQIYPQNTQIISPLPDHHQRNIYQDQVQWVSHRESYPDIDMTPTNN